MFTRSICVKAATFGAAFVALCGFVSVAGAANLACKPDVKVVNKKSIAIKVVRFSYTTGGSEFDEGLADKKLAPGESHTWKNQKLQHVASGNAISSTKVRFKDDTSGQHSPSDPWGPAKWSSAFPQSGDCKDSTVYLQEIH